MLFRSHPTPPHPTPPHPTPPHPTHQFPALPPGNKPDYSKAMPPAAAREFYASFIERLRQEYRAERVKDGVSEARARKNNSLLAPWGMAASFTSFRAAGPSSASAAARAGWLLHGAGVWGHDECGACERRPGGSCLPALAAWELQPVSVTWRLAPGCRNWLLRFASRTAPGPTPHFVAHATQVTFILDSAAPDGSMSNMTSSPSLDV